VKGEDYEDEEDVDDDEEEGEGEEHRQRRRTLDSLAARSSTLTTEKSQVIPNGKTLSLVDPRETAAPAIPGLNMDEPAEDVLYDNMSRTRIDGEKSEDEALCDNLSRTKI